MFLQFGANFVYDCDNARFKLKSFFFISSFFSGLIICRIDGVGNDAYNNSSGPVGIFERAFSLFCNEKKSLKT
jgi:hypothetical protein